MSFWEMSKSGKEAGGWAREAGATGRDQMYKRLGQADQFGTQSEADRNVVRSYLLKKQTGEGAPTVGDQRGIGEQIMPGVQPAIGTIAANRQKLADAQAGLTKAGTSMGAIRGNLDEYGRLISRTGDTQGTMVNDTYKSMAGRDQRATDTLQEDIYGDYSRIGDALGDEYAGARGEVYGTYGAIGDQIGGTYKGLKGDTVTGYGDLRGENEATYEDLAGGSGTSYEEASKMMELLRPGGEAAAARSARSYAPAAAATLARLRKAGIDPNSPEAASALRSIDMGKARSMDDALADATTGYVDRKTGLTLQKEKDRAGLMERGLGRELGLGENELQTDIGLGERGLTASTGAQERGLNTGIDLRTRAADQAATVGREQSALSREESLRSLNTQQALEAQKTAAQLGISQDSFSRTKDWLDQGNNAEMVQRAMEQQDYGTLQNLLAGMNDEQIQSIELLLKQYGVGQEQARYETGQKDLGTAGLADLSTEELNAMFKASQDAGNWGDYAGKNYTEAYNREAANAGWGKKLLGGIAGTALNMFVPGAGSVLSGALGGGGGGGGVNPQDLLYANTGRGSPTPFDFSKYGVRT